jgi:hypothetical protein
MSTGIDSRITLLYIWVVWADWSHQGDYMATRHGVTAQQANEALSDPDALVFDPD